jgi:hypothetical protein
LAPEDSGREAITDGTIIDTVPPIVASPSEPALDASGDVNMG